MTDILVNTTMRIYFCAHSVKHQFRLLFSPQCLRFITHNVSFLKSLIIALNTNVIAACKYIEIMQTNVNKLA